MFVPAISTIEHATQVPGLAAGFSRVYLLFFSTFSRAATAPLVVGGRMLCIEFLAQFAFSVSKNVNDDAKWHSDARREQPRLDAGR